MENKNESIRSFVNGQKEQPKKETVVIKNNTELIEIKEIQKTIITEDGRQLLT